MIMQLYAFKPGLGLQAEDVLVYALDAEKGINYFCPECGDAVRLRGGAHRRDHYFHLHPTLACRQSQKSLNHLQVQYYLYRLFPQNECILEYRFPPIKRIADVAWETKKLIFEIQCSPISSLEVRARNRDYASLGYQVIWILHDKRFNKLRVSAAEHILQESPHYYTNIDERGRGCIYDQFSLFEKGIKRYWQKPLAVDLSLPSRVREINLPLQKISLPNKLRLRLKKWPLFFAGDLLSHCLQPSQKIAQNLQEAIETESLFSPSQPTSYWMHLIQRFIVRPYFLFFQMLLEKACK